MNTDQNASKQVSPEHTKRLSFVRYLLDVGVEQSTKPEPLACVALLTFHDALEMFLQIVAEHFDAGSKRPPEFIEYWNLLDSVGVKLPQREAMRRFNAARVNLKHRGVLPAHVEIEAFRSLTENFLFESSVALLGVDFNNISLTGLIRSERVRTSLQKAESAIVAGDSTTALSEAKIAFIIAMREYELRPRATPQRWRTFSLRRAFNSGFLESKLEERLGSSGRDLVSRIDRMAETFGEAITVVGYNLDFEGYLLFKTHAPVAHEVVSGDILIEWMTEATKDLEVVSRCVAFVIDTAIRLESAR